MKLEQKLVENLGFSDKAAKVYLSSLELGDSTVLELSKRAGVKRTTIYDLLDELIEKGALIKKLQYKKTLYSPIPPQSLIRTRRRELEKVDDKIEKLEAIQYSSFKKPEIVFLYGINGFKQIWIRILKNPNSEYRIITNPNVFEEYVSQKYILEEIIGKKKKLKIKSKQLIVESALSRNIMKKDEEESRKTKVLPLDTKIDFTKVIADNFVAYISLKKENFLFIIEGSSFANNEKEMFEAMWDSI